MEKTKANTEKKFNGAKMARQAEKSLKAVFPNDTFYVSDFKDRVEVLYLPTNKCTPTDISVFKAVFCSLAKIKKEELQISMVKKESGEKPPTPAQAPVSAPAK
jgi:hypothetical protein